MTRDEFKRQLAQLQEVIFRGLLYYTVWEALWPSDEAAAKTLNWFKGFFVPVRGALHNMMFIEFAKVFDRDKRAASLPNLLSVARQDRSLAPNATPQDLDAISKKIDVLSAKILKNLKTLRDQRLAHSDTNPQVLALTKRDFDCLVEDIKSMFNQLSGAHDDSDYHWELQLNDSASDTREILRILGEAD